MKQALQRWSRPLISLAAAGMFLGGCATAPVASVAPVAIAAHDGHTAHVAGEALRFLTVNVELSDEGISPAVVAIPAGREVKLVVRNRGTTEHHYHVVGLAPQGLWRITTEEASLTRESNDAIATSAAEDDHAHHGASLGAYVSQAGVVPAADEVHAFAQGGGGGMDVLFFTATTPGTYEVHCTLHPDMVAQMMVFE
jgi:plastocyanin